MIKLTHYVTVIDKLHAITNTPSVSYEALAKYEMSPIPMVQQPVNCITRYRF